MSAVPPEREVYHIYPLELDAPSLHETTKDTDTDFSLRVRFPISECVLCEAGICEQYEDRLCAEDPFCGRLIIHGRSLSRC